MMGAPPINFGGFKQGAFQQYQLPRQGANVLGGQEGVNEIADTLTSESTKQLKGGNPVMMADNTKKETKLAIIEVDGEQLADNRSGGMMIVKDDKQKKTFGDFVKDVHKRVVTTNKMMVRSTLLLLTLTTMMMIINEETNFSSFSTIIIFDYSATH
jgi:hypothetical protein